jgi:HPt (histidine-containing phosphotransfer) domain-containing protein
MATDRDKCIKAGCDDYTTKPVDREKLLQTIQQHLHREHDRANAMEPRPNVLVSELADDPDMTDLLEMFVAELPGRIAAFEKALTEQDVQTLARLAHQLKGSAGGYGFPTITQAAQDLETSAKAQEDLDRLREDFERLADLCRYARAKAVTE